MQLYVEVGGFAQRSLNASYLGYLRSDVEMDESDAVVQTLVIECFERLEQLRRAQSELRSVASALLPFARSARSQLDTNADVRLNAKLLCGSGNQSYLAHLLNNDKYALAHLLCEQRQFDVALVLVAVAHDDRVALALHSDNGVQLGL